METQNTVNLLNGYDNENSKFATKKWYLIDRKTSGTYSEDDPITFLTKSIESSLCDYSDAYILVMGNITSGGNDTKAALRNCAPFKKCRTEINETFADEAEQCQCTISMSIVTINLILLVVYDNLKKTSSQKKIMEIFLILAQIIHHHLNTNQTLLVSFQMEEEKWSKIVVPLNIQVIFEDH